MPPLFRHRHRLLSGGVAIPVITGFTPSAGAVGDVVTITGINFGAARGIGSVVFTNTAAPFSNSVTVPNILSWSDTQIVVRVPDGVTFPYVGSFIRVTTNTAQGASSAPTFLWTGGAAHFTAASSQILSAPSSATLQVGNTTDFTFAQWVYQDSIPAVATPIAKGDGATNSEYWLFHQAALGWKWRMYTAAGATVQASSAAGVQPISTWWFIVAWHDQAANTMNIQVNNGAVNSISKGANTITPSTGLVTVGASKNSGALGNYLDGRVDGIGFWKRLLTAGEMTTLYNAGQGLSYASALALGGGLLTNLAAWWDLDDQGGSGATWVDRLGVSNLTAGTGAAAPTSVRGVR